MSVSGHDRSGGAREQRDWHFGPPSRRSFAFGLTHFQVSLGSGTAVFGFVLLVVFGWRAAWPLTCSAAVAGFLGFGVVADRRVDAWIYPLTGWVRTVVLGRRRWQANTSEPAGELTVVQLPPEVAGWKVVSISSRGDGGGGLEFGVLRHSSSRLWVAVCRVQARSFLLLDQGEKEARIGAWGSGLASFAQHGSPVSRLQWIERVALARDALDDQFAYLNTHRRVGPAAGHYDQLLAAALDGGFVHETYVVLQITAGSAGRQIRDSTREAGWSADVGAFIVLRRQVHQLARVLEGLDVEPLTGVGINRLIRTQYDPFADETSGLGDRPWPVETEAGWGFVSDGWVVACDVVDGEPAPPGLQSCVFGDDASRPWP